MQPTTKRCLVAWRTLCVLLFDRAHSTAGPLADFDSARFGLKCDSFPSIPPTFFEYNLKPNPNTRSYVAILYALYIFRLYSTHNNNSRKCRGTRTRIMKAVLCDVCVVFASVARAYAMHLNECLFLFADRVRLTTTHD